MKISFINLTSATLVFQTKSILGYNMYFLLL